jgi:hypothetical protein
LQAAKNDEKSSDLRGEKLQQHIKDNFLQVWFIFKLNKSVS